MTIATITPGAWQSVTTTAAETVFQNQSQRPMYILTGSTAGAGLREGYLLVPFGGIVVASGLDVSVSVLDGSGALFYMAV